MNIRSIITAMSVIAAGAVCQAQAIVDATGAGGAFTTINAALATAATDIVVKNTGLYSEPLLITRDVTIRGEDPNNRPIIAMKAIPTQPVLGPGDGIYIGGTTGGNTNQTIVFKNFILIPALTGGPTDDALAVSPNAGAVLNLTLENILCAPNNGSNQPLATSIWDNLNLATPGIVRIPDDGIYLVDNAFAGFDGDVNASFTNFLMMGVGSTPATADAMVVYPGTNGSATFSGVGTSFSGRYGAQMSNIVPFTITGTHASPGWVSRKNVNAGIIFFQGSTVTADNVVAVDNGTFGVRVDADNVSNFSMTNSLLANNGAEGFWSSYLPPAAKTWSITDSTIFRNGRSGTTISNVKLEALITNLFTLNITNSLIAGNASTGFENLSTGVINVSNSGVVTSGPDALASILRASSTGSVNISATLNADPAFINRATDPVVASSFDTTSNAYDTASTTAGVVNGYGDGPVPPITAVSDWTIYE